MITRRRWLATALMVGTTALAFGRKTETDRNMINAFQQLLAELSSDQQRQIRLAFDDPWHQSWHYIPRRRPGLSVGDLSIEQQGRLWRLLAALLSQQGMAKARGVIELEQILGEPTGRPGYRNPEHYYLVLFGEPVADRPWAWRFEGHHLSLSATLIPGHAPLVTPAFFGANPNIAWPDPAHRIRQHPKRSQSRPLGLARPRSRRRSLANPLSASVRWPRS